MVEQGHNKDDLQSQCRNMLRLMRKKCASKTGIRADRQTERETRVSGK